MKSLFLFVDKDLLVRDLLTDKFLQYLATKFKVVVFMQEKTYLKNKDFLVNGENIIYELWPCYNNKMFDRMKAFRSVFIRQFDYLSVQQYKKKNLSKSRFNDFLMPIAEKAQKFFTLNFFKFLEKKMISKKSKNLFKKYKNIYNPVLLVTASCGIMNFEAEGILLAEIFRIPTVATNFNWDNLTSKVRSLRLPNKLIVWNKRIKETAKQVHGYKETDILISGIMRFDPYFDLKLENAIPTKENFFKDKKLDPRNKTIVYSSTADFIYPYQKDLIKLLIKARNENKFSFPVNIFVRLHYKDPIKNYGDFLNLPNVYFEEYKSTTLKNDAINLKATMIYGDVHLNYASTISLDACALNRPIVNLAFPKEAIERFPNQSFPHYKPLVDSEAVRLAHDGDELVKIINTYFENPSLDSDKRKFITAELIGETDGFAYKRAVDHIVSLSNN